MAIHTYKTWQLYFEALLRGNKPFDVRKVDPERPPVKVDDTVRFFETTHYDGVKTGRSVDCKITFVLTGDNSVLPAGWFVMGWQPPHRCDFCMTVEELSKIGDQIRNQYREPVLLDTEVDGRHVPPGKVFSLNDPAFVGLDLDGQPYQDMGADYGPIAVSARPELKPCDRKWATRYGGLSTEAIIHHARENGVELTQAQLDDMRHKWFEHFTWIHTYLKGVKQGEIK